MSRIVDQMKAKYDSSKSPTKTSEKDEKVFVKFTSHRSRGRGKGFLADKQSYYSLNRSTGYGTYKATLSEVATLRSIPHINFTVLRPPYEDLSKTWS
jgi:hypothetical protein